MRTKLDTTNPFGYDRYGFAWHHIPAASAAHLDFGCGDGRFLKSLTPKEIKCLVGVDISRDAVQRAYHGSGGLEILHLTQTTPLPFPDKLFSSITILDVLEHVAEQRALLEELCRVLQDDGTLIVTVPRRHCFSGLDLGNLKFRFPRLHQWYYCRTHSLTAYERRYSANPDNLIGDVSAAKRWHEHFSPRKLAEVLGESEFEPVAFDGAGFFTRLFKLTDWLAGTRGPLHAGLAAAKAWDARHFQSANLFCVARKSVATRQRQTEHVQEDHDRTRHHIATADPQHVL